VKKKPSRKSHLVEVVQTKKFEVRLYVESQADAEFIKAALAIMDAEGISHGELARRASVSQPTISQILSGKHSTTLRTVDRIAQALNCDVTLKLTRRS
jgi:predicted transcriptional regulator